MDRAARLTAGTPLPLPARPSLWNARNGWLLAAGAAIAWSAFRAVGQGPLVNPGGWPMVLEFAGAALQPDLAPDFLALTFRSALVTLAYALCGTALSLVLGLGGGLLAAEVWWLARARGLGKAPRGRGAWASPWLAVRGGLALPRAIHEVIWGLLLVNVLGLNPWAAILAIAIPFGAITAKVFAEILDETPRGPLQALLASGSPPLTALAYGLVPAALPGLTSYTFYRIECSIRAAAVLGVIGAGGLGQEILLSFQSLQYNQMWTLLYALIALSGLVDAWSGLLRRRLGYANRIDLALGQPQAHPTAVRPSTDRVVLGSLVAAALLVPLSFIWLRVDAGTLWSARSLRLAGELAAAMLPPDLSPGLLLRLAEQTVDTLALSILAISIAAAGGLLLCFPAAASMLGRNGLLLSNTASPALRAAGEALLVLSRAALLLCRAIPATVWALLAMFVLFPGILPGALALGVYTLGVLGRLMAEVVEGLDPRPLRALRGLGAGATSLFGYGALPTAAPGFLSYSLYRWEVCSRETVVVGVVGAAGLGRVLTEQLNRFDYDGVTTTLLFFIGLTFFVDIVGARARRDLRSGRR